MSFFEAAKFSDVTCTEELPNIVRENVSSHVIRDSILVAVIQLLEKYYLGIKY